MLRFVVILMILLLLYKIYFDYCLLIIGSTNCLHHGRNSAARHGEGKTQINATEQVTPHWPQLPRHYQGFHLVDVFLFPLITLYYFASLSYQFYHLINWIKCFNQSRSTVYIPSFELNLTCITLELN